LPPVIDARSPAPLTSVPGHRVRIVDGNHRAAIKKRLKPLRGAAARRCRGKSLVVYDPDLGMVLHVIACEDGHTQERALMQPLLAAAPPGGFVDGRSPPRPILCGWHQPGSSFLVREHGANPSARDKSRRIGKIDLGTVFEQPVSIDDDGGSPVLLRRMKLPLNKPTDDGETIIRLLTNLPASEFSALALARLYRWRWRSEMMF
jgi:hypothetical protein